MSFDVYSTGRLLMAVQEMDRADSFLRDRYFPTTPADVFNTEEIFIDYRDSDMKLAPFVAEHKKGVNVLRDGFETSRYTPPTVAPRRTITLDDLKGRGFGEALFGTMSPAQREQVLALQDLAELDRMITRREESMAAETMLNNAVVVKAVGDDAANTVDYEVRYFKGSANQAVYTPTKKWDDASATILADLSAAVRKLAERGLPASDLVCSPDVADAIVNNEQVQKLLDNRRYDLGQVAPTLSAPGAAVVAQLNVSGYLVNVIAYAQTYRDDKGATQAYMPSGSAVLTAPGAGRTLYGAVNQIEQADGVVHTYANSRVPKFLADANNDVRTLTLTARPLTVPNNRDPWISFNGVLTTK